MIRFILSAALSAMIFVTVGLYANADTRSVYTIRDIPVDERAASVIEARQKAMGTARTIAARALVNKITLAEDRQAAGGVAIDYALAQQLAAAVDVQEEVAGAGRYRGTLAVVLNPREVRGLLREKGVPYVDAQGPLGLIVPVASATYEAAWMDSFGDGNTYALSPYVTVINPGYGADSDWPTLQPEASALGAQRGVIAELMGRDGAWRVRLSTVTAAGTDLIGTTRARATMAEAARSASAYMDEIWKRSSIVRNDGTRTLRTANVLYTSLPEWNTLRSALARSPLVSDFKTSAVSRDGALVTFAYFGESDRLAQDLRQRGIVMDEDAAGRLTLMSAVSAPRQTAVAE